MLPVDRRSDGTLYSRREQLPWPKDRRFRILSIDGGGIRGVLPASVLAELERRYLEGAPIGKYFDMIAGTSTGGIIALGLGLGLTAQSVLSLYLTRGREIFPPNRFSNVPCLGKVQTAFRTLGQMSRYRYEREPLQNALIEVLGERTFGDSTVRLVIPSFDGYGEVNLFKTPHHPDYRKDWKERAVDVALATSAAPTFFATYRSGTRQFADGGVWANNPVMLALVDVLACYDIRRDQIDILSLGCADAEYKISPQQETKGGIWHWREIMSAAMHLQGQNALGQSGLLIGRNNLIRVDRTPESRAIPIDDFVRSSQELPPIGVSLVDQYGAGIASKFLARTSERFEAFYG